MKLPLPTTSSSRITTLPPRHLLSSSFPATILSSSRRSRWARMQLPRSSSSSVTCSTTSTTKVVVIMGATGTGKSRLSLDLATRFFPHSEIINSDKMQVYRGLEITTNKLPLRYRLAVPHPLLASLPSPPELSPAGFRCLASSIISDITSDEKLPLLVGGSNSFIHSLLSSHYDPDVDFFNGPSRTVQPRYDCCFIWVDLEFAVLDQYLTKRVDDMLDEGMFEELKKFYRSDPVAYSGRVGITKAIGVPEFEEYFSRFAIKNGREASEDDVEERERCYERAVREIKDNTRQLAKRQIGKIERLRDVGGWELIRLDATDAVRGVMTSDPRADDVWEKCVLEPSVKIVSRFLASKKLLNMTFDFNF